MALDPGLAGFLATAPATLCAVEAYPVFRVDPPAKAAGTATSNATVTMAKLKRMRPIKTPLFDSL